MKELSEFLKLMIKIAPEVVPLVQQTIDAWDGDEADKDTLRQEIRPGRFDAIDDAITDEIKDLKLPERS